MKLISNELFLKISEVVSAGCAVMQTIYNNIDNWDVLEDEEQGKLIPYSQLKRGWREQIDRTFGGNAYQFAQFQLVDASLQRPERDYKLIDNYIHNGLGLKQERKAEYKAAASVLFWLDRLTPINKNKAAEFGCISVEQFWLLVREYIGAKGIKLPTSRRITDKLLEYQKYGAECLIHKGLGNDNSAKLANNDEAQQFLVEMAASALKLSSKEIWRHAKERGVDVSYQTVYKFLESKAITTDASRHGKKVYHNKHELRIHRRRLHAPHLMWETDGTPAPLWFINDEGKPERLYVAIVMDSMSRAFVGYAIGYTEDTPLMIEALKDAMRRTGYKPYELVSDRGAALMSGEYASFLEQWGIVHKPAQAGRARAKVIEPMQGVWMQNILSYEENFSGMNITTKTEDSHANPEFVKKALRSGEYTKEKVVAQIRESIARYNHLRLEPTEPTRAELLQIETEAEPVTAIEYAENCMMWRKKGAAFIPYYWSPDGITMQVAKHTYYYYPVLDEPENPGAFADWMNANAHNTFYIKYDPTDLDEIALYVGDGTEEGMRFKEYATLAPTVSPSTRWASDTEKANLKYLQAVQKVQTQRKATEAMLGISFASAHKEAHNMAEEAILLEGIIGNEGILTDENRKKSGNKAPVSLKKLSLNSQFDDIQD